MSAWYCIDILRRNSVLVTNGSLGLTWTKWLGVFILLLGWDASSLQIYPPPPLPSMSSGFPQFLGTHLYSMVGRGTATVNVLPKNTAQWPGQVSNLDLLAQSPKHYTNLSPALAGVTVWKVNSFFSHFLRLFFSVLMLNNLRSNHSLKEKVVPTS